MSQGTTAKSPLARRHCATAPTLVFLNDFGGGQEQRNRAIFVKMYITQAFELRPLAPYEESSFALIQQRLSSHLPLTTMQ